MSGEGAGLYLNQCVCQCARVPSVPGLWVRRFEAMYLRFIAPVPKNQSARERGPYLGCGR
jgi:hypothetical protein